MFGLISKRVRKFKRNVIRLNCSATILRILITHTQSMITTLQPLLLHEFFNNACRKQNRNNKKHGEFHISYSSGLYSSWLLISSKRLCRCLMGQLCALILLRPRLTKALWYSVIKSLDLIFYYLRLTAFKPCHAPFPIYLPHLGKVIKKTRCSHLWQC